MRSSKVNVSRLIEDLTEADKDFRVIAELLNQEKELTTELRSENARLKAEVDNG